MVIPMQCAILARDPVGGVGPVMGEPTSEGYCITLLRIIASRHARGIVAGTDFGNHCGSTLSAV